MLCVTYFAVPEDRSVKVKEGENRNKYLDFAWALKKLYNMKVTMIPSGTFGTVSNNKEKRQSEREIRGPIETIQTTEVLKSLVNDLIGKILRNMKRFILTYSAVKNSQGAKR